MVYQSIFTTTIVYDKEPQDCNRLQQQTLSFLAFVGLSNGFAGVEQAWLKVRFRLLPTALFGTAQVDELKQKTRLKAHA